MVITGDEQSRSQRKDVFISYNRRDKGWVNAYLTRLLSAAEVQFAIDERDFTIGAPLDESIRQLIKECRYTLLVMTPDWVQGKWTHYEAELAVQRNAAADGVSVLALKLKDCDVPPNIANSLYLDLCQARTRDKEIIKLLRQIGVSEERIANAQLSIAKKTIEFLAELFTEPRAVDEVAKLNKTFLQIQQSNHILEINKKLHDCLQDAELPALQLAGLLAESAVTADQTDWSMKSSKWGAITALCEKLECLVNYAEATPEGLVDVNFVGPLKGRADKILSAYQSRDIRQLGSYVDFVCRQIDRSLPLVNDRIVQHVKGRRLSEIVETIYTLVHDIEFDDNVSELLSRFRSKIDELVELELVIRNKVHDHEVLQNAEVNLLLCHANDDPTFSDIAQHWADVDCYINKLMVKDRYEKLFACSRQLSELINNVTVRDDAFAESVRWKFASFCHEMKRAFNKLDIDLLADCGKLKPRSDELHELLKRMQRNDNEQ